MHIVGGSIEWWLGFEENTQLQTDDYRGCYRYDFLFYGKGFDIMTAHCRGHCQFDSRRRSKGGRGRPYERGWKGCSVCGCFWEIDDNHCPCYHTSFTPNALRK